MRTPFNTRDYDRFLKLAALIAEQRGGREIRGGGSIKVYVGSEQSGDGGGQYVSLELSGRGIDTDAVMTILDPDYVPEPVDEDDDPFSQEKPESDDGDPSEPDDEAKGEGIAPETEHQRGLHTQS